MAGETNITVIGNLTDEPELKFTPSGAAVVNFTVASTSRIYDRQTNDWKEGDTLFLRCEAWREMAEHVAGSLQKGMRVIVTGQLRIRNYERQDGSRGTSVEIRVDEIGPSLRWATAQVQRAQRGGGQQGGAGYAGGQQGGGYNAAPAQGGQGGYGGGQQAPAATNPWSQPAPAQQGGNDAWGGGSTEEPPF